LTHLSLEKCNITDDILKVILDLKPHNKDTEEDMDAKKKPGLHRLRIMYADNPDSRAQGSLSVLRSVGTEEEPEEQFTGLVLTLKVLNLNKNQISDTGALMLRDFVKCSKRIEGLQIHWNKIRAKGSIALAKVIKHCHTIIWLDVAFNAFSQGSIRKVKVKENDDEKEVLADKRHQLNKYECTEAAWKWKKAFSKNYSLMHVDMSFNGFSVEDS
jgi:hypothetical protein